MSGDVVSGDVVLLSIVLSAMMSKPVVLGGVVRERAMGRVHWVESFGGMSGCYGGSIERCSSETEYGGDV